MRTHSTLEDLSAYIDGEAKNADRVCAHLQQCVECAQRHMALAKISAGVQALPAPEPRASFARRVVAVIEDGTAYRRPWWQNIGAPVAIAAALLLVVGLFAVQRGTQTTVPAGPEVAREGEEAAGRASEALARGESSDSADDWSGSAWIMAGARKAEQEETEIENLLLALAEVPWFDYSATNVGHGQDMSAMFAEVYDEQPEALLAALTTYARSGEI